MSQINSAAGQCFDEVVALRRDFHRHPEVGRTEFRTSEIIREKLAEYGVDRITSPCPTAVVGIIKGSMENDRGGKCIAIRADIDALPVKEDTGLPFASENEGVMHACGHDMHASILLGVAKILCGIRDRFQGTVKLIFQHSEDTMPGGAKELVQNGVMEDPKVDAIIALHMMPDETRVGQIALISGPATTAVDIYNMTVSGKGGHGSAPHTTNDPILAACQIIVLMQQIVSRRVDPLETAILSIGSIHSGSAPNVIPGEVKISGVARSYSESVRKIIKKQVFDIAKGIGDLSGCKVDIEHIEGYPTVTNNKDLVNLAADAISAELGTDSVVALEKPLPFSEDFSYFGQMTGVPSAYLLLYGGKGGEELVSLHNSKCILLEDAMPNGMAALASTAVAYLNRP